MKKTNLAAFSFLSSLGVVVYIILVALFMNGANRLFPGPDNFLAPLIMMLLLVFSAAFTGFLVLGKPVLMYLEGSKKEAIKLFIFNIAWIFIFLAISLLLLALKVF
jgi:hypothetical protein